MSHTVLHVHGTEIHRLQPKLTTNVPHFLPCASLSPFINPSPELEPEPPDFTAKVFWPLLCPVWRKEHQSGCDEQYSTTLRAHAPQVRLKGLNIQAASIQEGKREVQTHF